MKIYVGNLSFRTTQQELEETGVDGADESPADLAPEGDPSSPEDETP